MLNINIKKLNGVCSNFFKITNIMIVVYDENENLVHSYPGKLCEFCQTIRQNTQLAEKCKECDSYGFKNCKNTNQMFIYQCHMGLTEAITPICEDGTIIGYLMLGQILYANNKHNILGRLEETAAQYGLCETDLRDSLEKMPIYTTETVVAMAELMSMCACYLWYNQIVMPQNNLLLHRLKVFIEENLAEKLTVELISKKLFISKSKLYMLSINSFRMGISDYISLLRIEKAKRLLRNKEAKISEVAELVGIPDSNYFSRTFKKKTGLSPKKWQSQHSR